MVHLHVHSEYSLLDGSIKVKSLVKELVKRGAKAAALTDHDGMHGAMEFYLACQAAGIQGIIGYEANVEPLNFISLEQKTFHLILLAKTDLGLRNLFHLCTLANTIGLNRHGPQSTSLTWQEIREYSQGLVCLTSCGMGELASAIKAEKPLIAQTFLKSLTEIFEPQSVYVEVMDNGLAWQKIINKKLITVAQLCKVPCVATADVHYLHKEDKDTHLSLLAIKHKLKRGDVEDMPEDASFHLCDDKEMLEKWGHVPEVLENSLVIAELCQLTINTKNIYMPDYRQREDEPADDCLVRLSWEGLESRKEAVKHWMKDAFTEEVWQQYKTRLEYELSVILKMKFAGYFLIVQDFINWAKEQHIPVGPGRGSAAGSVLSYALKITNVDPLRFHLMFERFLNPERISMPDIDTDFCQSRRDEVLQYVYKKYGPGSVAQIVTFGRMMAKNALKNLARIHGWSFPDSNAFAKLIPGTPGITLEQALKEEKPLQERLETDERAKVLWDGAVEVEGTLSSLGIHAAGVIISDNQMVNRCPLMESAGQVLTQFEHKYAEKMGLIKFDFLGLKTLTVIDYALKLIKKHQNISIDIDAIELEDSLVYGMMCTAHVTGLFQLESSRGFRKLVADLQPNCFEDVIVLGALFRPGPLGSGMVEDFVKRKKGINPVVYAFEQLESILKPTYGIVVYQEQVQQIAATLASYSLGEADLLRRAMGKKDKAEMDRQKVRFIKGAKANGFDEKKSDEIFELMAKFAEYGFNKSHSTAYGVVTYQTAWLKTYYPTEFFASLLTQDLDNTDKVIVCMQDCRRMGITLLPFDVNASYYEFSVVEPNVIRCGLGAIKGLGQAISEAVVAEREKNGLYNTVPEFILRLSDKKNNKKSMESLIKAGAFDSLASNRCELIANMDFWMKCIHQEVQQSSGVKTHLFQQKETEPSLLVRQPTQAVIPDVSSALLPEPVASGYYFPYKRKAEILHQAMKPSFQQKLWSVQHTLTPAWSFQEMLKQEVLVLGHAFSAHEIDAYQDEIDHFAQYALSDLAQVLNLETTACRTVGIVVRCIEKLTKENKKFATLILADAKKEVEMVIFPRAYAALTKQIQSGDALLVHAKIQPDIEVGSVRGIVEKIEWLEQKRQETLQYIVLEASEWFFSQAKCLERLQEICKKYPGRTNLYVEFINNEYNQKVTARLKQGISCKNECVFELENTWPGLLRAKRVYKTVLDFVDQHKVL